MHNSCLTDTESVSPGRGIPLVTSLRKWHAPWMDGWMLWAYLHILKLFQVKSPD